jgi:hypothetical protein
MRDTPRDAPRLGWTTGIRTQAWIHDADDVVFSGSAAEAVGTA